MLTRNQLRLYDQQAEIPQLVNSFGCMKNPSIGKQLQLYNFIGSKMKSKCFKLPFYPYVHFYVVHHTLWSFHIITGIAAHKRSLDPTYIICRLLRVLKFEGHLIKLNWHIWWKPLDWRHRVYLFFKWYHLEALGKTWPLGVY